MFCRGDLGFSPVGSEASAGHHFGLRLAGRREPERRLVSDQPVGSSLGGGPVAMQRCLRPRPRNVNLKAFGLTRTHHRRLGGRYCLRRRLLGNRHSFCRLGRLAFIDFVGDGDLDLLQVIGE